MPITELIDGMVDLINKNIVAKTNLKSNALTGEVLVNVDNSFHFDPGQEIVLIDYGYNDESSPHYSKFEYAVVEEVNNTHWITLTTPIQDPDGGWMISNDSFIQKTIGHDPLYSDYVFYGDREVIPTDAVAITVEPIGVSNEWIYLMGGLSEEYRVDINIYGKDIETDVGMRILNKYTDAVYQLFNDSMHIDVNNYESPLLYDVTAGAITVVVEDNATNREEFVLSSTIPDDEVYEVQDNENIEIDLVIRNVEFNTPAAGQMRLTLNRNNFAQYGLQPL